MADRTEEPRFTLSALIYVVSFALFAAATIVSFSIASLSLLYTAKEMPEGSGIRDRRAELKPVLSDVVLYTHGNAAPVPAETRLPSPAAEATLRASPPAALAAYDMQPLAVSGPGSELPPLGASEASVTEDASRTGTTPTLPIPAEQRDRVFREFEMYNNQKVKMDGDNAASKGADRPREKR
jgi:hypothetical protein